MSQNIPQPPPRWARGDVGREIGKWIMGEIEQALQAAGIHGSKIDAGHVVGVIAVGVSKISTYLATTLIGTRGGINLSTNFEAADDIINDWVDVDLSDTAVTPDTYGDTTHSLTLTVDAKGRVTGVAENVIAAPPAALDDLTDVTAPTPTTGEVLTWNGTAWVNTVPITLNQRRVSLVFQFGDNTNAIVAGTERDQWVEVNFEATIEGWSLLADASGSMVVDVWKDTYANYPPVVGDSITAAAKPTLTAQNKNTNSTLTGWTTAIARGDTIKVHVDSASTVKGATLTLFLVKT